MSRRLLSKRGQQAAQRQADPEPQSEILVQQTVGVCPDGIERGVAQHQLSGDAHGNVQPQRQHDIKKGVGENGGLIHGADKRQKHAHGQQHPHAG